ncbi:MAG: FIST C-terminal domain-containing protein [Deltaproteobacteria bacterium]|nr:FIST C-terminal domain-containing protein [Deltaproteobacteria bacterium]
MTVKVGTGLSTEPVTGRAVEEAARSALAGIGVDRADAALCWLTTPHAPHVEEVCDHLGEVLDVPSFAGCIASGVTVGDRQVSDGPGVGVMAFADPDPDRFRSILARNLEKRPAEVATALVDRTGRDDMLFAMLSTSSFQPRPFLQALQGVGSRATLTGGGAVNLQGSDFVFTEAGVEADGASALLIRTCGPLIGVAQSCQAVTPPYLITACQGRVLAELDRRPAEDVLVEVMRGRGFQDADLGRRVMVGLGQRVSRVDFVRGEFVVRPLLGVETRLRALFVGDELEEGMSLVFVLRDREAARQELNACLMEMRDALNGRPRPSFALVADCGGRNAEFHGMPDFDAAITSAYLEDVPMGGFASGFEIAPSSGAPQVHLFSQVVGVGW